MESTSGIDKEIAFSKAKEALTTFLAVQGISHFKFSLSDDMPMQHPKSGKFKHIISN